MRGGAAMFGPEYHKINSLWKRTQRGIVIPGEFSTPEFEYLADAPWRWTEKVDGTNIRLHLCDGNISIGGRTDNAQIPGFLIAALQPYTDPALWQKAFPDMHGDVTLYGEGYGAKIQKGGGNYRADQGFILFDARVGDWWLKREDVEDVADKFGLEVVPTYFYGTSLSEAWEHVVAGTLKSAWRDVQIEGLVGRPQVDLFTRGGERIIAKVKVKDWTDYARG